MSDTNYSLDQMELTAACDQVRQQARVLTLLTGMSPDHSNALVDQAVSFYITARVRRRSA